MSARKTRPARGTLVTPDMSLRDIAAALGVSTSWLSLCKRLAAVPRETFEEIVEGSHGHDPKTPRLTAERVINLSRGWDTSVRRPKRCCPHCGKPLGRDAAGGATC